MSQRLVGSPSPLRKIALRFLGGGGWIVLTLAIALSLVAATVSRLINAAPIQSADLNVPPVNLVYATESTGSAWQYLGYGQSNHSSYYLIIQSVLGWAVGHSGVAQVLIYATPLLIAPLSAYVYFRGFEIPRVAALILSLSYLLSPWLSYNFLSGQPLFVWLFALLPLSMHAQRGIVRSGGALTSLLLLAFTFAVAISFSLQSLVVFVVFSVPMLASTLATHQWGSAIRLVCGVAIASATAIVATLSTLPAYFAAVQTQTGLTPAAYFGGFSGSDNAAFRLGVLLFSAILMCELLIITARSHGDRETKGYALGFGLVTALFGAIYYSIPGESAYWAFHHLPFLTPFLNPDKFLLVASLSALICGALMLKQMREGPTNVADPLGGALRRKGQHLVRLLPHSRRRDSRRQAIWRKRLRQHAPYALVVVLLFGVSTATSPYADSPADLVTGHGQLAAHEVPRGYSDAGDYLLSHGVSFGFGPRTLVVPTNPGETLPFYIATTTIPGYIQPSRMIQNLTGYIASNQSGVTKLLALLGVEFIVIPPSPPNPWWPSEESGKPTSAGIAPGEFIAVGNPHAYIETFSTWPMLSNVFNDSGFTIFKNALYLGPVYGAQDAAVVHRIINGDFGSTANLTRTGASRTSNDNLTAGSVAPLVQLNQTNYEGLAPLGPELVANGNLTNGSGWAVSGSANTTLLSNGTFRLGPGSTGISASQPIALRSDSCYALRFHISTNPGYDSYPPQGDSRTYAGVYWSSGAAISPQIVGNTDSELYFAIRTPGNLPQLDGSVVLYAEPPMTEQFIYTDYRGVSLRPSSCAGVYFPFQPTNWTYGPGGSVLPNGTFRVAFGSSGFSASQSVALQPRQSYQLNFHLTTDAPYFSYPPPNFTRTYAAVYWPGGAAVFDQYQGPQNGNFSYVFTAPPGEGPIGASLVISTEAPIAPGVMFTTYSLVSLYPIDGRDMFLDWVRPVSWVQTAISEFTVGPVLSTAAYEVTICTSAAPGWELNSANNSYRLIPNQLGLLAIQYGHYGGYVTLSYSPQTAYVFEISLGYSLILALGITTGVSVILSRSRHDPHERERANN